MRNHSGITETGNSVRLQINTIVDWVRPGSFVLDLGCGDGELMLALVREKKCRVQGIEIDEQAIYACVRKGMSVLHGDVDTGLPDYRDASFDYVILHQSMQQVKHPETVLAEALRVGKEVIISFPNFAHYSARVQILFGGRTPVTPSLPYQWYDTPNVHFLSISDFHAFCRRKGIRIRRAAFIGVKRRIRVFPNLFAHTGIFLLASAGPGVKADDGFKLP